MAFDFSAMGVCVLTLGWDGITVCTEFRSHSILVPFSYSLADDLFFAAVQNLNTFASFTDAAIPPRRESAHNATLCVANPLGC